MNTRLIVAGCALAIFAGSGVAPGAAQDAKRCFIEVQKLMAAPPAGIDELGGAIRRLDETLRPQVEEIKRLKEELDGLQQRQQRAMTDDDADIDLVALEQERERIAADLEARHATLKADYATQQKAIVGPVQTRVAESAHAFGTERGCSEIKMARAPDLAALEAAGARDLTGDFVSWFGEGQS